MSRPEFSDRTVVVSGGAGGIGAAVLRRFEAAGATLFNLDTRPPADDTGLPGRYIETDVTDQQAVRDAVDQAVEQTGRLDAVIACAGINRDQVAWKLDEEDWRRVLAVNLDGTFHLLRAAIPHFRAAGAGTAVAISSINGERGSFGQTNYAASKAGVIALVKSLARETGRFGIRVNAVSPGYIETPMTAPLPAAVIQAAIDGAPLGRVGRPEEIAEGVFWLCSGSSSFVTGQVLRIDGGLYT